MLPANMFKGQIVVGEQEERVCFFGTKVSVDSQRNRELEDRSIKEPALSKHRLFKGTKLIGGGPRGQAGSCAAEEHKNAGEVTLTKATARGEIKSDVWSQSGHPG